MVSRNKEPDEAIEARHRLAVSDAVYALASGGELPRQHSLIACLQGALMPMCFAAGLKPEEYSAIQEKIQQHLANEIQAALEAR